ncbi:type III secretion system stator protein SctL [Salinicola rhizosphaerae]|uniref:Type 3 secretion system stator protein n=1 Tax=Salinicola rhizosphaerae TaxID=1443141 RepID=A0ABQ3DQC1_9GAMM|nr:type III secretion system stator protein SctL [Salinicola rhizosphaerae]GHB11854.1 type III secretion protein [Salinicola rhizosphaerae]
MNDLPRRPGKVILRAAEARAWTDGFAFLDRARERAESREAEVAAAREAGYADGFAAGRRDGERQAATLLAATHADVERYMAGLEPELSQLTLGLLRRILDEFDDAERIARCVRRALGEWRQAHRLRIRVAPALERDVAERLAEQPPAGVEFQVEADPQLDASQCLLVSPVAVMDIGVEAQLGAIDRAWQRPDGQTPPEETS